MGKDRFLLGENIPCQGVERLCRNIPDARLLIRQVIAPLPPVYNPFYALPPYQPLEHLRSTAIQHDYPDSRLLSMPNGFPTKRCSFPEKLLSLVASRRSLYSLLWI